MQQRNLLLFFVLVGLFFLVYIPLRQRLIPETPPPSPTATKTSSEKKPTAKVELPAPPPITPASRLLTLGDSDIDSKFNLQIVLDPLGGGVRSIAINKFRPSDEDGRPGKGTSLDLVPAEANLREPSHLLNHYDPRQLEDRPLDTLGRRVWEVVEEEGKAVLRDQTEDGRERQRVSFRTEIEGVIVTKRFTLVEGDYHVGLEVDLERPLKNGQARSDESAPIKFAYQLSGAKGLPIEGKWYTATFRNAMVALEDDRGNIDRRLEDTRQLDLWGGGFAHERAEGKLIRYAAVAVQYFASVIVVDDQQENQRFLKKATASLERAVVRGRVMPGTLHQTDRIVLLGDDGKTVTTVYMPVRGGGELRWLRDSLKEEQRIAVIYHSGSYDASLKECPKIVEDIRIGLETQATHSVWENDITVRVSSEPVSLKPGTKVTHRYLLYNGPVKPSLLRQLRGVREVEDTLIDRYVTTLKLNTLTDYQSPGWVGSFSSFIGWSWLVIHCTNLMHWILVKMHLVIPSYGLSIIFLTLLVRLLMFPLSRKQAAMGLKMQALQPELKKLAAKHKDDRQAYAQAQMELFRQHGVNPLGSCWIILLQMPIFMGLYFALQESIQFRLASFWPTWIVNLAAPDMMLSWGRSIPWISRDADYGGMFYLGPYFNLLPLFAVGLMVVQQQLMMPPPADKEQEMQQKMMRIMMIVMGLFFYKIAAGLCIYIITSTLWGFAERKLLPKAKPIGIDTDLDKRIQIMTSGPRENVKPATNGEPVAITPGKKPGKNKRKLDKGKLEEKTGSKGLGKRLADWWSYVLEQAKKKER